MSNQQQSISDVELVKLIFQSPTTAKSMFDSFKPAILGALLLIVLMLPQVDSLISHCGCESQSTVYLVKALIFVIVFYLFINDKKKDENNE